MRLSDQDQAHESMRPKGARLDPEPPGRQHVAPAAAAGRADALDPAAILELQRTVGNAGTGALLEEQRSPVHDVIDSGGQGLDDGVRAEMEGRMGHDFGDVRLHTDSAAHDSATSVNAHAYTVGSHVVFQRDRYDPSSTAGKTMLAHELTHVVQQRSGPVDGSPAAGGINVSDPSDRFEREAAANADRVMSGPTSAGGVQRDAGQVGAEHFDGDGHDHDRPGMSVQREGESADEIPEDEPTAQGMFVQREGEEDELEQ